LLVHYAVELAALQLSDSIRWAERKEMMIARATIEAISKGGVLSYRCNARSVGGLRRSA